MALLRALIAERERLGLVVSVAHLHHGIRGAEADGDAEFVAGLAETFGLELHVHRVDTPGAARARRETLEEAARNLRYAWFAELIASGRVDAVATGHTLDDQAETVIHRLLRGAWTEGLSGIQPVLRPDAAETGPVAGAPGTILRPMLAVRRKEIEEWLRALGQPWREDSTNQDDAHTRNRIRHHLLPILTEFNPQIRTQLAQMATLAGDEEAYWQVELARLLPSLLLPGRAVRGGGRAASTHPGERSVAIEVERLRPLAAALRRRVLREAARHLGAKLNFEQTEQLMAMCGFGSAGGQRPARAARFSTELSAERTPRELRLLRVDATAAVPFPEYSVPVPGEVLAEAYGLRLEVEGRADAADSMGYATLRAARPGDRVQLRHSRGPKRVKEVLERMGVAASDRVGWPVLEWQGQLVWMRGADLESAAAGAAGLKVTERVLKNDTSAPLPRVDASQRR